MSVRYNVDFKKEVVKTYMAGDKSLAEMAADFNVAKSTIRAWAIKYSEECQYTNTTQSNEKTAMEIRKLNKRIKEQEKEIAFLKKAAAFFAKEID